MEPTTDRLHMGEQEKFKDEAMNLLGACQQDTGLMLEGPGKHPGCVKQPVGQAHDDSKNNF